VLEAHPLERLDAPLRLLHQIVAEAELDGLGRARHGACRPEPIVDPVIAERALRRAPGVVAEAHHPERAGRDAVPAAIADVLVDVDRPELGAVDGARRTRVETPPLRAVLATVRNQEPGHLTVRPRLLHEADEPEGLVREVVVVLIGAGPMGHSGA